MRRRRRDGRPRVLVCGMIALLAAALLAGCSGSSSGGVARVTAHVTISTVKRYQRIAGFGVSEGFGQAKTLMSAPASVQQQVLSLLYSRRAGPA